MHWITQRENFIAFWSPSRTAQIPHLLHLIGQPRTPEPPSKRARRERPLSTISSTQTDAAPGSSLRPLRLGSQQPSLNNTIRKVPTFVPWDRDQFLERLESFSKPLVYNWKPKADRINEVAWAKRGWKYVDAERVGCVSCGQEVYLALEEEDQPEESELGYFEWKEVAKEKLADKYEEMITTGHSEGCLWRTRGCDRMFFFFQKLARNLKG